MSAQVKRFALLLIALSTIGVALVACQAPQPPTQQLQSSGGVNFFHTPSAAQSPTPTFPPFTIGAWPSNYSPNNTDTITIYVLVRKQDTHMLGPGTPPSPMPVTVVVGDPLNLPPMTQNTDQEGLAAITFPINDPNSGQPVRVDVTANYQGQTYTAETFFTPSPMAAPTPTPTTTANGGPGSPTPTATP